MRSSVVIRLAIVAIVIAIAALLLAQWRGPARTQLPPVPAAPPPPAVALATPAPDAMPDDDAAPADQAVEEPDEPPARPRSETCVAALAIAGNRVFWPTPRAIVGVRADGGSVKQIVKGAFFTLMADRAHLYFSSENTIERANLDGTDRRTLAKDQSVRTMVVDDNWLYWVDSQIPATIWRVSTNGGTPQKLGTGDGEIIDLAVSGGRLFLDADSGIRSLPITGGTVREEEPAAFPMAIDSFGSRVAWASGTGGEIHELTAGKRRLVFDAPQGDTDHVLYHRPSGAILFTLHNDRGDTIRATHRGTTHLLATTDSPISIAATATDAYWLTSSSTNPACILHRAPLPAWK